LNEDYIIKLLCIVNHIVFHVDINYAGCSTVDRILTLNTVVQTRCEVVQPLWVTYIGLKAAFDSIDWEALHKLGLPGKIISLILLLLACALRAIADQPSSSFIVSRV